jgi:ABC-2 type transport system permease protein
MLISFLQNKDLSEIVDITMAANEEDARSAVDQQRADVALIIPVNFTQAALTPGQNAAVILYQDPTLTIGPGIVKDLVNHFMDGFSGAKIAAKVSNDASGRAAQQYASYLQSSDHGAALHTKSPQSQTAQTNSRMSMIGPIMAGMMILFVFFMAANGAESIVREQEEGTLARLFTTPTSASTILSGKFVGVFATLVIQVSVLLTASAFLFHISWGRPLSVLMATFGLLVVATGFGVMLMSFIKSTRQAGLILGGVLTLTAMVGGLITNGIPNVPKVMDTIALSMPQGWAMLAWKLSLAGNSASTLFPSTLMLVILGCVFFAIGLHQFRRRFA